MPTIGQNMNPNEKLVSHLARAQKRKMWKTIGLGCIAVVVVCVVGVLLVLGIIYVVTLVVHLGWK